MPISRSKNLIFIHIPKNAGESIEKSLGMYKGAHWESYWGVVNGNVVLQHLTATELKMLLNDDFFWQDAVKFAVVRNPWSKAVSEYNWYLRYGPPCEFSEWLRGLADRIRINTQINILETAHNVEQYKFIYDEHGQCMVDHVLRFESIQNDFGQLMKRCNVQCTLTHAEQTRSSSSKPYREYYKPKDVEIVARIYKRDIEMFGYEY